MFVSITASVLIDNSMSPDATIDHAIAPTSCRPNADQSYALRQAAAKS
jgi:hypothetical protein